MFRRYLLFIIVTIIASSCRSGQQPATGMSQATEDPELQGGAIPIGTPLATDSNASNAVLSSTDLNRVLPENIITEIGFFGGLGGGDYSCYDLNEDVPTFLSTEDFPHVWMQPFQITVCGLEIPQNIQVTLETPNGNSELTELAVQPTDGRSTGEITFEYLPLVFSPTGWYGVIFRGPSWELETQFEVSEPSVPTLYEYESNLYLVNFLPGELVRLFVYETTDGGNLKLIGWKEYRVNQEGDLTIASDFRAAAYVALGEAGEQSSIGIEPTDIYCQGAPSPAGVVPGGYVESQVDRLPTYDFNSEQNNWVRGDDWEVGRGTLLTINSNANCLNQTFAWIVMPSGGVGTWKMVPEADRFGNYLRPIENIPATSIPDVLECPGTMVSRLKVGMNAEVTTSGMAPQLSLRAQPSVSAGKIHVIAAGRDLVILDGPICADNSYWWYIRSEQGFEGWAREGDSEDYWIDPLP